jgi:hypothetical protein
MIRTAVCTMTPAVMFAGLILLGTPAAHAGTQWLGVGGSFTYNDSPGYSPLPAYSWDPTASPAISDLIEAGGRGAGLSGLSLSFDDNTYQGDLMQTIMSQVGTFVDPANLTTYDISTPAEAAPEPATYLATGCALMMLGIVRRRRKGVKRPI